MLYVVRTARRSVSDESGSWFRWLAVVVLIVAGSAATGSALHSPNQSIADHSIRAFTPGQSVDVEVTVAGRVSHPGADERYFLVVQSEASGDVIFPQGELLSG